MAATAVRSQPASRHLFVIRAPKGKAVQADQFSTSCFQNFNGPTKEQGGGTNPVWARGRLNKLKAGRTATISLLNRKGING